MPKSRSAPNIAALEKCTIPLTAGEKFPPKPAWQTDEALLKWLHERDSGTSLKLFGFIAESVFTFTPESCSGSSRKSVRNHPGIAFRFPRIPHFAAKLSESPRRYRVARPVEVPDDLRRQIEEEVFAAANTSLFAATAKKLEWR